MKPPKTVTVPVPEPRRAVIVVHCEEDARLLTAIFSRLANLAEAVVKTNEVVLKDFVPLPEDATAEQHTENDNKCMKSLAEAQLNLHMYIIDELYTDETGGYGQLLADVASLRNMTAVVATSPMDGQTGASLTGNHGKGH